MWNLSSTELDAGTLVSAGLQGGPLFYFNQGGEGNNNYPICRYQYEMMATGNPENGSFTDSPGYEYVSEVEGPSAEQPDYFTGNFYYVYELDGLYDFSETLTEFFSFEDFQLDGFISDSVDDKTYVILDTSPSDLTSFPSNTIEFEIPVPEVFNITATNGQIETIAYELNPSFSISNYNLERIESQGLVFVPDNVSLLPHTFTSDSTTNTITVYAKNTCKPIPGSNFDIYGSQAVSSYASVYKGYIFDYTNSPINYDYIDVITYANFIFTQDYNFPIEDSGLLFNPNTKIALGLLKT